jgi:hypothetical protein
VPRQSGALRGVSIIGDGAASSLRVQAGVSRYVMSGCDLCDVVVHAGHNNEKRRCCMLTCWKNLTAQSLRVDMQAINVKGRP